MDMNIFQQDKNCIINTYKRFDLAIVKGEGCFAYDNEGKEYIDLTSGIGVNSLGFCDKEWSDAVCKQANTLNHTSNLYYTLPQVNAAKKLVDKTEYRKVFFCNSGAEANECAIKIARKYSFDKYGKGRSTIITLTDSFHGRTMTTLTATGQDVFHNFFFPFAEGFKYCPANDSKALADMLTDDVCAVMFEFVQGEGGVKSLDAQFIKDIFALCKDKDILVIADEVQSGVGRTGRLLTSQVFGVVPDITTLAKGLGGGLPVGAVLVNDKTQSVMGYSHHGTTFGGNPIVCAGVNIVLDKVADDDFLAEVRKKGDFIRESLAGCKHVEEVTGLGMMVGIKVKDVTAGEVVAKGMAQGVLMLTAKDRVRLLPPLNIDFDLLKKAVEVLKQILND